MRLSAWILAAFLQVAGPPPASLQGFVVRLGGNEVIAGATVELSGEGAGEVRRVLTQSDGRFSFANLSPGEYRLVATHVNEQYVPAVYGQRTPKGRGRPLVLGAGQNAIGVRLAMAATGAIAGRVFDADGNPVVYARVFAMEPAYDQGRRTLNIVQSVLTDDKGEYRLFWLAPGRYYVAARPEDSESGTLPRYVAPPGTTGIVRDIVAGGLVKSRMLETGEEIDEVYRLVFYGGETDLQKSTPVELPAGGSLGAVDIPIEAGRTRAYRIRGVAIDGATGRPLANFALNAMPADGSPSRTIAFGSPADENGRFEIAGVPPGRYRLRSGFTMAPAGMLVEVGAADLENVRYVRRRSGVISGRVTIDGVTDWSRYFLELDLRMASGATRGEGVAPDGTFTLTGLDEGDYEIAVGPMPHNGYIQSIRMGGIDGPRRPLSIRGDTSVSPIEIVIGTNAGAIAGRVSNEPADFPGGTLVTLAPASGAPIADNPDLYRSAVTDAAGRFRISGLPPGEHKVFAWEEIESGAWQDREFLARYAARSASARVLQNSTVFVELTTIPAGQNP